MSNINTLILYEYVPIQAVNDHNAALVNQNQPTTGQRIANGMRTIGRGLGYTAAGAVAAPYLAAKGLNAFADSGMGKGLVGAGIGGLAAHYGGQFATQGANNLMQLAADHGINNAVSNSLAEWIPGIGSAVSAGTSMGAQHLINSINDEKDRVRGIAPTSSWLGNAIKNGIAGAAGFLGGPLTSAIQGLRAGWAQHSLDKLKQQQGMYAARYNAMNPPQMNMAPGVNNGY